VRGALQLETYTARQGDSLGQGKEETGRRAERQGPASFGNSGTSRARSVSTARKRYLGGGSSTNKKDPGVDLNDLSNREKTVLIGDLQHKYPLKALLKGVGLSRSSYYYQCEAMSLKSKYAALTHHIIELFELNNYCYGYRRIHGLLGQEGTKVSEKIVRTLMEEAGLVAQPKRKRKYSSYQGEITPAPENLLARNFHADAPNKKWLTNITEFPIPAGKAYLSPIVDCFDGMLVSWTISTRPDAELVNTMLDVATSTLNNDESPIIHSDRGCHYRWPGWIERIEKASLVRSMSKKGCLPDNATCEGLFGRIKNEMFYNRNWIGVTMDSFIELLNKYLQWHNTARIKMTLEPRPVPTESWACSMTVPKNVRTPNSEVIR